MALIQPEIALRLLQELTGNKEKYMIGGHEGSSHEIVWCLLQLVHSGDVEQVEEGLRIAMGYFQAVPRFFKMAFIYQLYNAANFILTALLCNYAACNGISFPSHLLVETTFQGVSYRPTLSRHIMGLGKNSSYNLGITSSGEVREARLIPMHKKVKKISMSNHHTLFLTDDGSLYGCGRGSAGQLGPTLKGVVVEPTIIFEGTKRASVVDMVAGEGFSAFVTTKNEVILAGKYEQIGHTTGEFHKSHIYDSPVKSISLSAEPDSRLKVCGPNDTYLYSKNMSDFMNTPDRNTANHICFLEHPAKKGHMEQVNIYYTVYIGRIFMDINASIAHTSTACVQAYNNRRKILYSVNGMLMTLHVKDFAATRNGRVALIASVIGLELFDRSSTSVYTGTVQLMSVAKESGFSFVGNVNGTATLRVVLELVELPGTHGASKLAISPDGDNLIYLMDNDLCNYRLGSDPSASDSWAHYDEYYRLLVLKLAVGVGNFPLSNLGEMNKRRQKYGLDEVEMDFFVPSSLAEPQSVNREKPKTRRADFIRAIYPTVDDYLEDGEIKLSKLPSKSIGDLILLSYLRGDDIISGEKLDLLKFEMIGTKYQENRRKRIARLDDITDMRLLILEFLNDYLREIGLEAREFLYDNYLLRSTRAEEWEQLINGDVTVVSSDEQQVPFIWDLLLLQSEYFDAAMNHSAGNNIVNIDFPISIVKKALRVFLEPSHLYDLPFEDLFHLLELYDRYLCYAAVESVLDVAFETVTESTLHFIFDAYDGMEHHRDYIVSLFQARHQLLLYWKCPGYHIPLDILKKMEEVEPIAANHDPPPITDYLLVGKWRLSTLNWAIFEKDNLEEHLLEGWKNETRFNRAFEKMWLKAHDAAVKCNQSDTSFTGLGIDDRTQACSDSPCSSHFNYIPMACAVLLDDKKFMKEGKNKEIKKPARTRTTSSMCEPVAASPVKPSSSLEEATSSMPPLPVAPEEQQLAGLSLLEEPLKASGDHLPSPSEEAVSPTCSTASNEQNVDPEFPGVSSTLATPKTPKEKFIFSKKRDQKLLDLSSPKMSAIAPWAGKSSGGGGGSKSFKEIQEEEAERERRDTPPKSRPIPIGGATAKRERRSTWREEASAPSSTPPVSLAAIMAEEERRLRPDPKPAKQLEAVATEERAIQELQQMYSNDFDGEAVVTVSLA